MWQAHFAMLLAARVPSMEMWRRNSAFESVGFILTLRLVAHPDQTYLHQHAFQAARVEAILAAALATSVLRLMEKSLQVIFGEKMGPGFHGSLA